MKNIRIFLTFFLFIFSIAWSGDITEKMHYNRDYLLSVNSLFFNKYEIIDARGGLVKEFKGLRVPYDLESGRRVSLIIRAGHYDDPTCLVTVNAYDENGTLLSSYADQSNFYVWYDFRPPVDFKGKQIFFEIVFDTEENPKVKDLEAVFVIAKHLFN